MNDSSQFPHVKRFSEAVGIPAANLMQAFQIERDFHYAILNEESYDKRLNLYGNVYKTVHPIYGKTSQNLLSAKNPKDKQVFLFRKELLDKSILDVGCGEGYFLASVANKLKHKRLVGIDISIPPAAKQYSDIEFITADIIDFKIDEKFDVVFSDQVFEHIAPRDIGTHLMSVRNALCKGGIFIICVPNRLFGPSDVTRIIDFSYTNRIKAQGTHLNELTYTELIPILKNQGFGNFKTIVQIPKIKYLFSYPRINPSIYLAIENNKFLMNMLHAIKFKGRCIAKFEVVLICEKI
jgi:2-polyprenyl-3-methyl-5-hydroxy-6-metoxy-1,4-benzoquinol methylase